MHRTSHSISPKIHALAGIVVCAFLLIAHPPALAASTLQVVKAANHEVTSGATSKVGITIAAGDLAVVWCSESINNTSVASISDSSGARNVWTQTSSGYVSVSPTARGAMFYSSLAAQLTSVTCTWSGGINGRVQTVVYNITGAATSGIEDSSVNSTNTNNVTDLFSNASGNTLTTTNANDILLFGIRVTANQNNFAAGTNYAIQSGATGQRSTMSYQIVSSVQSAVSTNISYPNAAINGQGIYAAFKAAGGVAAPSITSLSPASGPAGTSVTIAGSNFGASQGSSTVTFNGTVATPTSWGASSINVPVPSGATTGNVIVTVAGVASNPVAFTVIVPPSITNLSPTFAPLGASVTISGSNFGASQGTSTVTFNGVATAPTSWSTTSITAPVPSGATTGNVVVTVGGLASNGVLFRVGPSITSVSPTFGPIGTSVTITGTSFGTTQGTSTVTLGASTFTPTSWSDTVIVAPVPAGATTGNVIVMVNGVGSNRVLFTVTPAITSLNPTSGPVGTSVTISGTSFGPSQGTSTVAFNGTAATPTSWSDTGIVVPVPTGATTGNVVVSVGGFASNTAAFTVTVPPNITSLNPTSGPVGTSVTITGSNFGASQGTSTVTFNGTAATPTSWSASSIVVPVPSSATSGNVVVTVSGLASNGVSFTVIVPPSVTSLSPTSGPVGASITITGTNFGASQGTSTVTFNGAAATPTSWSATSIVARVPSGATSGNIVVTVSGLASNGVPFTVLVPPSISSLSPASGPVGTSVTITGSNFGSSQSSSTVTFNGTAAVSTSWSATSVVVVVPNGATSGNVVITVGGLASNGAAFTVGPSISNLSPASGPAGTSVTITGTNFGSTQGTSSVTFGSSTATVTSWSDTSVVLTVPSDLSPFTFVGVKVVVSGVASNTALFSISPNISSLSPTSGAVGTSVTITGTNFASTQGSSTVTFNGTAATPTSWSATSILAPVPNGAMTGNVVVTVSGLASNGVPFTVLTPPSITTLSPTSGPAGTSVTITGANFGASQGTSTVTFNGTAATPTSWSASSIVVPAPTGATTGNVVVTVSGLPSNSVLFTVIAPPSISSLSPTSGSVGTSVTIAGANFGSTQGTSALTFNGTSATPTTWTNTGIVAPVPVGATTGNVVVTVNGLPSNGAPFTVNAISVSVSPTAVTLGTGAQQIFSVTVQNDTQGNGAVTWSLSGAGCTGAACGAIQPFNAAPGEIYNAPATAPSPNTVTITATSVTDPTKSASATITLVQATAPNITGLNPSSGPLGSSVTITGTNFGATQGSSVLWFSSTQGVVTSWSNTSIVATVPTSLTGYANALVQVVVLGLASNQVNFSITPPPAITSLSPTMGPVGSLVTIAGNNFGATQGTSTVTFNGALATPTSWSATSVVVSVPTGATTGNVIVTVAGVASNGLTFAIGTDVTPPTAPSNLVAGPNAAFDIALSFTPSTDNVGVANYLIEQCQGVGCTNFTQNQPIPGNIIPYVDNGPLSPGTSYSFRMRARDAAGNLSGYSNVASATTNSLGITNLNPFSGPVGTPVTVFGGGFGATQGTSTVSFNGTQGIPTSWTDTGITVPVPAGATSGNVVVTVNGGASNGVLFTVTTPPPTISGLTPSSALASSGPFTLTVNGTNFASSSVVQWNGTALPTTFLSSTQLQATVSFNNTATAGAAKVTVSNSSIGGGVSNVSMFLVGFIGGSNFAAIIVNQSAQDLVYDPKNQVFYLSATSTASTYPNTIAVLDPAVAWVTSTQATGNNPNVLAISDDSQFLYAGIDGTSTVQRFTLPGLVPDISYQLGSDPFFGPYTALDLQVAPGAPHTTAVSRGITNESPSALGGIEIFDDSISRSSLAPGFGSAGGGIYDSLQWGSDATALFAANDESTGFDFYTLSVTSTGVSLVTDYPNTFSSFRNRIHFDPGTNLVYSDDGHVVNPLTGSVSTTGGFYSSIMVPDSNLNLLFFVTTTGSSSVTIFAINLNTSMYSSIGISNVNGNPIRLIRWAQNGLAFNTDAGQIVLVGGNFIH